MAEASLVFNIALLRIIITSSLKKPQWKQTVILDPQQKFLNNLLYPKNVWSI